MNRFVLTLFVLFLLQAVSVNGQDPLSDSAKVARTLTELLDVCAKTTPANDNVQANGNFYKAAPYIVYRGEDKKRQWKDISNYAVREERSAVDHICSRINGSVNQDKAYKLTGYQTQVESEGKWHVIMVSYTKNGKEKEAIFAFLKINGRFALGDID
jgi:hypothetical protein